MILNQKIKFANVKWRLIKLLHYYSNTSRFMFSLKLLYSIFKRHSVEITEIKLRRTNKIKNKVLNRRCQP